MLSLLALAWTTWKIYGVAYSSKLIIVMTIMLALNVKKKLYDHIA